MKKTVLIVFSLLAGITLKGQEAGREADSLRHAFGRQQVRNLTKSTTPYADTLDTGNPGVKVVL